MSKIEIALPGMVVDWLSDREILVDLPNREGPEREWMEALQEVINDPTKHQKYGQGWRVQFKVSPQAAKELADELDERREFELMLAEKARYIRPQQLERAIEKIRKVIETAKEARK